MIRNWTVAALAVCLLVPAASMGQGTPRRPSTRPRVRVETREGPFGVYAFGDNRGRIGVIVDTRVNAAGDKVDRKSTRLNSSHSQITYAAFCLKKTTGATRSA